MTTPASDAVHAANRRLHDQANAEQRAAEFDRWAEQAMRLAEHTVRAMDRVIPDDLHDVFDTEEGQS